ncbi:hypothetical protein DUNSADRAFT_1176 [Dunaliella salina]|uniref:Uncharacterized protein n=1 Tax=Dunaliella salina TaxID=3046 RepID=A0ABQ7FXU8_DUNSA|nr:hypothetical protein DUNSADRAFT_1176 [Dunaliella salina]|eukprot:KAF5827191.1 hypothetical protein DUNSADRAFT_1176 [Dunaliella salina]
MEGGIEADLSGRVPRPATGRATGSLCSLVWLYDTEYVAAVDNTGHMRVFHEWGGMALLELPEHVAKAGLAQPSRPHIQCNKLLGDQDAYPGQLQQLMQNKQPRPQAAYQLCTPAGASYSSLTSTWMAYLDGTAPEVPFLAQPATPTPPADNRDARNKSKNSKSKKGKDNNSSSSSSSSRELLLLVISNCQVVMALTFHLSGTPPSPPAPSHPSKSRGARSPSSGPSEQQDGVDHDRDAEGPSHDIHSSADASVASFTRSSLNPLYSKSAPGEEQQLTPEQQQQQMQQQEGAGDPGAECEPSMVAEQSGVSETAAGGLPGLVSQGVPLDRDTADWGGLSHQQREALLLGVPQVPLGSSLLAYAAAKRQQQQQQQQEGLVQHQGKRAPPASIQWHQLADHWYHLCASLPESAVPQSEPAMPPAPLSAAGSPRVSTRAACLAPPPTSKILPSWPSGTAEPSGVGMHSLGSAPPSGEDCSSDSIPKGSHQGMLGHPNPHPPPHHIKTWSSLNQLGSSMPWEADEFALDDAAVEALLLGDAALLDGRPLQGLRHYVHAHVFGFLPSLLVLLRCGQLGPSLHLLSKCASLVAKNSTQGNLSTLEAERPPQQQHSTPGLNHDDSSMATYSELAADWEAQARGCLHPFLEGDQSTQAGAGHGSGDAQQLMHAAQQQLSVACQCLAHISCALHEQQQQQVQAGGQRGVALALDASRHAPPHASMGVISLPTPIVWHPLVPVHTTTSTSSTAAPEATEAAAPSGGAQPTHVCCFRLFHTAFDVKDLQRGLQPHSHRGTTPAVSDASAPTVPDAAATAPQPAPSQQGTHTAAASVAAALSDPRYAVGLLAVAHACEVESQKHLLLHGQPPAHTPTNPHTPSPPITARVNWRMMHQYPSAARMAAVWREVGDWRKAVVLAFSVHRLMQQQPRTERHIASGRRVASSSKPLCTSAVNPAAKRAEGLAAGGGTEGGAPAADAVEVKEGATIGGSSGSGNGSEIGSTDEEEEAEGQAERPAVPPPGSCLQIGWATLEAQMASDVLAGLEVDAACRTLLELLHIPRYLLGPASPVYSRLLREVNQRLAGLLPKRLCISPLSPLPSTTTGTSPKDENSLAGLLDLSHESIRAELLAHLAAAATAVLQGASEAHNHGVTHTHADSDSPGGARAVAAVLQALFEDVEVEACLKMLLQWQGEALDGQAFKTAIQQARHLVCSCAQEACVGKSSAGDDVQPLHLLPLLKHALIQTPSLLPEDGVHAVLQHMQALLRAEASGGPHSWDVKGSPWGSECEEGDARSGVSGSGETGGVDASGGRRQHRMGGEDVGQSTQTGRVPTLPPIEHNQGVAKRQAREHEGSVGIVPVRDAGELSMLVDCACIMGALLTCLCPLLPRSLPQIQALVQQAACGSVGNGCIGTQGGQQQEEGTVAAANADNQQNSGQACGVDPALPGHLATLLSVDWALVTRAHVATLLHTLLTQRGSAGATPSQSAAAQVESMLLHWTVALVEGAAFHPQAELQALVHGVLSAAHGTALPSALVASVDGALRQRRVLNARIAEEVARLKKATATADAQEANLSGAAAQGESTPASEPAELVTVGWVTVVTPAQVQEQWRQAATSALWQLVRSVGGKHEKSGVDKPTESGGASTSAAGAPATAAAEKGAQDGQVAVSRADSRGSLLLCVLSSMVGKPWLFTQPSRTGPEALSEELGSCFANPLLPIPLSTSAQSPPSVPDKGHAGPTQGPHHPTESLTPLQQLEGLMRMSKWALVGANDDGAAEWKGAVAAAYDAWTGAPAAKALVHSDPDADWGGPRNTARRVTENGHDGGDQEAAATGDPGAAQERVQGAQPQKSGGAQAIEPEDESVTEEGVTTIVGGPGAPPVASALTTDARPPQAGATAQRQQQLQPQRSVSGSGVDAQGDAQRPSEEESRVEDTSAAKLADFWWEGEEEEEGGSEAAPEGAMPGRSAPRSAGPSGAEHGGSAVQQQHQRSGKVDGVVKLTPNGAVQGEGRDQIDGNKDHEPQDSTTGVAAVGSGGGAGGGVMTPSSSFSSASAGGAEAGAVAGSRKTPGTQVGAEHDAQDMNDHPQSSGEEHSLDQQQQQQQQQEQSHWQQQQQLELEAAFARDGQAGLASACARAMGYTWPHGLEEQDAVGTEGKAHPQQGARRPSQEMGAAAIAKALGYGKTDAQAQGPSFDNGQDSAAALEYAQRTGAGRVEAFLYSVGISPAGSRAGSSYPPSPALTSPARTSKPGYPIVFSNNIPAPAHISPAQGTPPPHAHSPSAASELAAPSPHHPTLQSSHTPEPHSPAATPHSQHSNVPSQAAPFTPARSGMPAAGEPEEEQQSAESSANKNPGLAVPTSLNHLDGPLTSAPHSPALHTSTPYSPSLDSPPSSDNEGDGMKKQAAWPPHTHKQSHSSSGAYTEHPPPTPTTPPTPPSLPKTNSGRVQQHSVLVTHPHPHMRTALSISRPGSPPLGDARRGTPSHGHTDSRGDRGLSTVDHTGSKSDEGPFSQDHTSSRGGESAGGDSSGRVERGPSSPDYTDSRGDGGPSSRGHTDTGGGDRSGGSGGASHPWGRIASDTRNVLTGRTAAQAPTAQRHSPSPSTTRVAGHGRDVSHAGDNAHSKQHSLLEQSLGEMLGRRGGGAPPEAAPRAINGSPPTPHSRTHKNGMLASSIGDALGARQDGTPGSPDARAAVLADGVGHFGPPKARAAMPKNGAAVPANGGAHHFGAPGTHAAEPADGVGRFGLPGARAAVPANGSAAGLEGSDGIGGGRSRVPNGALASGVNDMLFGKQPAWVGANARDAPAAAAAAPAGGAIPHGAGVTAPAAGRRKLSSSIEFTLGQTGRQQQQQQQLEADQEDLPEGLGNGVEVMENVLYDEEKDRRARNNPHVFQNDIFETESDLQPGAYALKQGNGPQPRSGGGSFSSSSSGNPLFDPGSHFVGAKQAVC